MSDTSTKKRQDKTELDQPHWAVVSFERVEAAGMTYAQAVEKLQELDENGVSGLCIVTDAAALRITT
jgi:hypothetical protein